MANIIARTLSKTCPESVAFFIRDSKVQGFAIKVNPSRSIKFVAEVYHGGRSNRKTVGEHPITDLSNARQNAIRFIQQVRAGQVGKCSRKYTCQFKKQKPQIKLQKIITVS